MRIHSPATTSLKAFKFKGQINLSHDSFSFNKDQRWSRSRLFVHVSGSTTLVTSGQWMMNCKALNDLGLEIIVVCAVQVSDTPDPDLQPVRPVREEVRGEHPAAPAGRLCGQQGQDHSCGVQGELLYHYWVIRIKMF